MSTPSSKPSDTPRRKKKIQMKSPNGIINKNLFLKDGVKSDLHTDIYTIKRFKNFTKKIYGLHYLLLLFLPLQERQTLLKILSPKRLRIMHRWRLGF